MPRQDFFSPKKLLRILFYLSDQTEIHFPLVLQNGTAALREKRKWDWQFAHRTHENALGLCQAIRCRRQLGRHLLLFGLHDRLQKTHHSNRHRKKRCDPVRNPQNLSRKPWQWTFSSFQDKQMEIQHYRFYGGQAYRDFRCGNIVFFGPVDLCTVFFRHRNSFFIFPRLKESPESWYVWADQPIGWTGLKEDSVPCAEHVLNCLSWFSDHFLARFFTRLLARFPQI